MKGIDDKTFEYKVLKEIYSAVLLAMVEGIIYAKQKSLLSIWIVHYVFGIVGIALGFV